ncbi:DNA integrity scanning diadenylate cyclase DisA [Candidatus Aerophobetes bacterium]|uniref:DNA integrity scanning protein DisA n=1 Tax=Aerophobetes bacterium TaxID=2030807 RepID=A0A7V5HZP4_UNCAE|nr:DNA integrity scanning diadenylate cyclase DisA [Candidatus Aerophobetes bacterium]HHF98878.1 DNA integrity scanning protein DisA [Candidatus Aerophobetes bacterium]
MAGEDKKLSEEFLKFLKLVSPGTDLREGLEIILQRRTGGLIVIGDNEKVLSLIDGGFQINSPLTPAALAELAKMDGAIILSRDAKRILYANTQLIPDYLIPTEERGTRHRSADRMAKQTGCPVIAISETRSVITLYQGENKYVLKPISELLRKSAQALQTMEKYRIAFDEAIGELDIMEFKNEVKLYHVVNVVQKGEVIKRIKEEVERYIIELGEEARLVEIQFKEILGSCVEETEYIIKDYARDDFKKTREKLDLLELNKILETNTIVESLGYEPKPESLDLTVFPRGYRVLSKIPRLPKIVIDNVVNYFGSLYNIMKATPLELTEINEVGEKRAQTIKVELERIKDKALLQR